MLASFHRHLYSTDGETGLASLAARAQQWVGPLSEAWQKKNGEGGAEQLFDILAAAIFDLDRSDLSTRQIRLRPISSGGPPVGVISKLARAFVEPLAINNKVAERDAMEALAAVGHSRGRVDLEEGFRAALAELFLEEENFDRAIEAIDANLSLHPGSPYSQYLLYDALKKQKQAGLITESPRVCLDDLSDRFCERPFTTILTVPSPRSLSKDVTANPDLHACDCAGMLPYPLGGSRLEGADDAADLWNGPEAQEIRRSILHGEFAYCAPLVCPYLVKGNLPKRGDITDPVMRDIIDNNRTRIASAPRRISLAHDVSCNIACPTCRSEIMTVRNGAREVMDVFVDKNILPLLENAQVDLIIAGDGDPIASKHYRRLLHNLDPVRHSGVGIYLVSNGLLITPKEWESLSHIHDLIKGILISIDAADAVTYEDVRRPGKWSVLVSNMDFMAALRRTGAISYFVITFVVQKKNFEQMPAFVELGRSWSVDRVLFSKLFTTLHAESFDTEALKANSVIDDNHPDHGRFLEVLRHPILRSTEVDLFNIAPNLSVVSEKDSSATAAEPSRASEPVQLPPSRRPFWKSLLRRREKNFKLNA